MEGFFNVAILDNNQRYTLSKQERLKSRKTIEALFEEGKSFTVFPFRVVYQLSTSVTFNKPGKNNLQAGFTVSTRHFKKAVDRNRIRRLMREAYRLQKNNLKSLLNESKTRLVIFIMYAAKDLPDYPFVYEKFTSIIERLTKISGATIK